MLTKSEHSSAGGFEAQVREVASMAEAAWRSRDATRMGQAMASCARLLRAMPPEQTTESGVPDGADGLLRERAMLWLWRGRLLVLADQSEAVLMGLDCLQQAVVRLELLGADERAGPMLVQAWMNRGHGFSRLETSEGCMEAVVCYDRAADLLRGGDVNALGAALMNRAVNLMRLDDNAEACRALEQAVEVLSAAAQSQVAARRNLSSAWANLGVVRRRLDDPSGALLAQREAVACFRPLAGKVAPMLELGARMLNLAQAAHDAGETDEALAYWREALGLFEGEAGHAEALEFSLRARHGLGVSLGALISANPGAPESSAWVAEAGDMVETGLSVLDRQAPVEPVLAELGERLYAFGAWLYRTQQPRFLSEFLIEHLRDDAGRQRIVREVLAAARQDVVQGDFPDADGLAGASEFLQGLNEVEKRLRPADGHGSGVS